MGLNENPIYQPDPELLDILQKGKSVNAALMRLVYTCGGEPELTDTNAQLIDKLAPLLANSGTENEPLDPGIT